MASSLPARPTGPTGHTTARRADTSAYRIYRRRSSAPLEASTTVRWEEQQDPDRTAPPRRWGVTVAIAGLGVTLAAGAALYPASPPPPSSGTVAAEAVDEPTGRGGLPHRVPAS